MCRAPAFARTRGYLDTEVKDPTDYIVYDYDRLHRDLDEAGIPVNDYWNVWRLTPEVFRVSQEHWVIKRDFKKLIPDAVVDNAEYVLHTTVRIILAKQRALQTMRTAPVGVYRVVLKNDGTTVYAKASRSSPVLWTTPTGVRRLDAHFWVEALDQDGDAFYQVGRLPPEGRSGYILHSDVDVLEEGTITPEEVDLIWRSETVLDGG
jgi:hypothetical protein